MFTPILLTLFWFFGATLFAPLAIGIVSSATSLGALQYLLLFASMVFAVQLVSFAVLTVLRLQGDARTGGSTRPFGKAAPALG